MQTEIVSFRRDDESGVPALAVAGEIDLSVAEDFTDALATLCADAELLAVVDLTEVSFFGSTGVNVLLAAAALAELRGVDLVVSPSGTVRQVLDVTDTVYRLALPV